MLIRFLSYLASMIGARRYKPMLISCLAVVFSIASISVLVSTFSSDSSDAASTTVKQEDSQSNSSQQKSSTGLNGFEQKPPKSQDTGAQANQSDGSSGSGSTSASSGTTTPETLDITLNTAMVTLSKDSPDAAVTIAVADSSKVSWTITPEDNDSGLQARIEQQPEGSANAVIRFHADTLNAGTYRFVVAAKGVANGQSASKIISVTVN